MMENYFLPLAPRRHPERASNWRYWLLLLSVVTTLVRPTGAATSAELVNALGQVMRRFALPTAETVLDLRELATGVYVLRLSLNGGFQVSVHS